MRLDEIRGNHKSELASDEALQIARERFLTYFKRYDTPAVYRGMFRSSPDSHVMLADPTLQGRASANTSNEYTILMSELPTWKAFPKRSHSFICTTSFETARTYGSTRAGVYAVILPDSFKMGVCDGSDVWYSFPYIEKELGLYSDEVGEVVNEMIGRIVGFDASGETTIYDLQEGFQKFQEFLQEGNNLESIRGYQKNPLAKYLAQRINKNAPDGAAFAILSRLFNPTLNNFEIVSNIHNLGSIQEDTEVWTDSQCLFVKDAYYSEFRKSVLTDASLVQPSDSSEQQ